MTSTEKTAKAAYNAEQRVLAFISGTAPVLFDQLTVDQQSNVIATASSEIGSVADLDAWLVAKRAEVGPGGTPDSNAALAHAAYQSVCFDAD